MAVHSTMHIGIMGQNIATLIPPLQKAVRHFPTTDSGAGSPNIPTPSKSSKPLYESALTHATAAKYLDDFTALILTGYSAFTGSHSPGIVFMAQQTANTLSYERFRGLENRYITPCSLAQYLQFSFY